MLTIGLKNALAHKRRLIGTSLAVVLGVAFLAATLVVGDTARASFDTLFTEGNAGTDVVVRGAESLGSENASQRRLVDESLVDELATLEGVAAAAPSVEALGQLTGADGAAIGGDGPPTIAGNWIDDPGLNPYVIVEGRAPDAPGEVVINRGAAAAGDLTVGSRTTVRTPAIVEVEVVGIADYGRFDGLSGTTFTAFTLDEAQRLLLGGADTVRTVRIAAGAGVSPDELAERIESVLPEGIEALTAAELTAEQNADIEADFLGWFERSLLTFSGVALLVAAFTIHNTFSVLLAQRTRESALLRAVGASRSQVLRSATIESVLVGLVGSVLGIGAGIGLAAMMKGFIDADRLAVDPGSLLVALAIGVVSTVLAGLVPAIKTSRIPAIAALRDTAAEPTRVSRSRFALGAALAVPGVALIAAVALTDAAFSWAGAGAVLTVTGMVVLGPVFARGAAALLGWPLPRWRGVSGDLARRNAMRNPRRTAGTATALTIGVCVVTLFMVFGASAKASIDQTLAGAYTGDFVVINEGWSAVGFSPALATDLEALPEVAVAAAGESAPVRVDGEERIVTVGDPARIAAIVDLDIAAGSVTDMSDDQLAVSQRYAEGYGLGLGSSVEVSFTDGDAARLEVGAVYRMDDLTGDVLMPTAVWEPHADQRMLDLVLLSLTPDAELETGRAAIDAVAARHGAPPAMDRAEYLDMVGGQLDQVLTIVYAMLGLSIVIALVGIGNTLSLSIHERTSELGLLRAVGQTRKQLRSMVRWESVIIAVFGTLGGVALGMFLAWGLLGALASEGFSAFAAPAGQLAVVTVLGALVGIVAASRPARRAARLDVLDAIRVE